MFQRFLKGVKTVTKFEQIGVERQHESESKIEAQKNFSHSCKVCCYRGIQINCDKCAIAFVHNEVSAYFDDCKARKAHENAVLD